MDENLVFSIFFLISKLLVSLRQLVVRRIHVKIMAPVKHMTQANFIRAFVRLALRANSVK